MLESWTILVVFAVLLVAGVRIAYVMFATAAFAFIFVLVPSQPQAMAPIAWEATNSYALTALPMFVLMAELLVRSGLTERAYAVISRWLRRVPGGSAHAVVVTSGVFASMSGSSVANSAALGTVACPQMVAHGYSKRLSFGVVAAGGTLGILIPPSAGLIVYGSMTGVSVGHLFLAGIVPGILLIIAFLGIVAVWGLTRRDSIPRQPPAVAQSTRLRDALELVPLLALVGLVLGGIYGGVFSPTEAGGIGAFLAIVLLIALRRFSFRLLYEATVATARLTAVIVFIIAGAAATTYIVNYLGLTERLVGFIEDASLSVTALILALLLLYLVLGTIADATALLVMSVPVLYPLTQAVGIDGVWFGIFTVLLIEAALLSPPVGLNLFVLMKIDAGQKFEDIAMGALPFIGAILIVVAAIIAAPEIVTWLPDRM